MLGEGPLRQFESWFVAMNRALVAFALAAVFAIVFVNVVGRFGFGRSFSWVEEAARHLMILGAFAGGGLALREGRMVAITFLPDMLPPALARLVRWGIVIVVFAFLVVLTWLGIQFVQFGWNKQTMSTGMPRGVPYMAIPIGCLIMLVHLALFARRFVADDFDLGDDVTGGETA